MADREAAYGSIAARARDRETHDIAAGSAQRDQRVAADGERPEIAVAVCRRGDLSSVEQPTDRSAFADGFECEPLRRACGLSTASAAQEEIRMVLRLDDPESDRTAGIRLR